jgi:hypothetical protein
MRQSDSDLDRLINAYGYVERGWVQGNYARGNRVCILGSIGIVCGHTPFQRTRSHRRLIRWLSRELPLKHRCWPVGRVRLVLFNDSPGRTHKEVLGLFERAIARRLARAEKSHTLKRLLRRGLWTKLFGAAAHRQHVVGPADAPATDGVAGDQWVDMRRVDRVDPHASLVEPEQLTTADL